MPPLKWWEKAIDRVLDAVLALYKRLGGQCML
jgi:hypothetical protein